MKKQQRIPMTVAEHVALGNALKIAKSAMVTVRRTRASVSRAYKASLRIDRALLSVQCELDDEVCRAVRADPQGLATRVYYGELFVAQPLADPADTFDGWMQPDRVLGE